MFSRKELHVRPCIVRLSNKRKRSSSHEVIAKKARAEVIKEKMELFISLSSILVTLY